MIMRLLMVSFCCCLASSYSFAFKQVELPIQLGFFSAHSGKEQHINLEGLIGNQYTITDGRTNRALIGAGYFISGLNKENFQWSYGINGFYFGQSSVSGNIIQENLFTNLSYQYNIQHVPVYLATKAKIYTSRNQYSVILDGGIGSNFMRLSHYNDIPLDDITVPDSPFLKHSTAVLSVTAGLGLRLENGAFEKLPLECGYRFFYLGQSSFNSYTTQQLNKFSTGKNYANALICSVVL
jgi:hypothetical protein